MTIKFGTSGWRALLADEFTFANAKPDKPVKAEDVYTNAYSSKIKPLK